MRIDAICLRKRRGCIALCCLIAVESGAAVAAEWSIEPSVSAYEEYNDNIHFTAAAHPKVWQHSLTPSLKFSNKTEVSEVSGQVQVGINRYTGEQGLNQDDKLLLLFARRMAEQNTWSLNTSYRSDTTSERATTGLVQARTQRSALSFNPSWTHTLTERASLNLDYQYQDVKYDKSTSTDYTYQQAGGSVQYLLSERDTLNVSANYSTVDYAQAVNSYYDGFPLWNYIFQTYQSIPGTTGNGADSVLSKSNARLVQVSLSHLFSETLSGVFALGGRNTNTTINHTCNGKFDRISAPTGTFCTGWSGHPIITFTDETRANTYSLNANLDKQFETGKVSGLISRDVSPSGSGLVQTDRYGIALKKSLTENITGFLDSSLYRTTYVSLVNPGSRYFTFEPRLSWRVSEWWVLDGGIRYARVKSDDSSPAVSAKAVYLNLTYNWPKISVSR